MSAFDTGETTVDREHRELLVDINDFSRLIEARRDWDGVVAKSEELRDKCLAHFLYEEEILERTQYPKRKAHVTEHRRIGRQLDYAVACVAEAADFSTEGVEAAWFMRSVLVNHFIRYDIAYKSHVSAAQRAG